jgi:hypothetical protein
MFTSRKFWATSVLAILGITLAAPSVSGPSVVAYSLVTQAANIAGDGIAAYISPPFVQGPSETLNAGLEDFNSLTNNTVGTGFVSAIGTFSGSYRVFDGEINSGGYEGKWGGANSTTSVATAGGTASKFLAPSTTITLTFPPGDPVKYLGFWWSAGGGGDTVKLYREATDTEPAATFETPTLHALLGSVPNPYPGTATVSALNGSPYTKGHYFGRPRDHSQTQPTSWHNRFLVTNVNENVYSHAYINIFASGSVGFKKVEFIGGGLEFDNVAISTLPQPLPTPELVFLQSVLGTSVNFNANGGSGSMAAQTSMAAASLSANTFVREGYTFSGWNTQPDGFGTAYASGATFPFEADTILYAQWTAAPPTDDPPTDDPPAAPPAATSPPATSPPSTAPATTVPTPIPDLTGALPRMRPGEAVVYANNDVIPIEVFLDGRTALNLRGEDWQLRLTGDCASDCTVASDTTGRETLMLRADGKALVDGFGFMPGTLVHFWLFSDPVYLGSLPVAADGTFDGSVFLTDIDPGEHTLQVNGVSFDGQDRSANLGVIVTADASPATLPTAGSRRSVDLMVLAFSLAMLGLLITVRRRSHDCPPCDALPIATRGSSIHR